jgi:hypothetical protein
MHRVRVTVSCHLGQIPKADAMNTVPTGDSSCATKVCLTHEIIRQKIFGRISQNDLARL